MFDGRHVNQEATRKGNVRGNARAFLGNWFLRDLHQYLLPFTQKIGNCRLMTITTREATLTAALMSSPLARCFGGCRLRRSGGRFSFLNLCSSLSCLSFAIRAIGGRLSCCRLSRPATSAAPSARSKFTARARFSYPCLGI